MNYEGLLDEAYSLDLIVKEAKFIGNKGRIKGNRIAIKRDIPALREKSCILAEELGHYYTSYGDILNQVWLPIENKNTKPDYGHTINK